jgi:hypothetical protein
MEIFHLLFRTSEMMEKLHHLLDGKIFLPSNDRNADRKRVEIFHPLLTPSEMIKFFYHLMTATLTVRWWDFSTIY